MLTRNPLGSLLGLGALLMSAWPFAAHAADIHVPADQPTLQAGINAANNGDVVLVADGTYTGTGNKNLDFQGKAITVRSESNDPTRCIIDCQGSENGFSFISGETAASLLSGLTIRNAAPTTTVPRNFGHGIACLRSSPTVTNCILAGNSASAGGGMFLQDGSPTVSNCVFIGNNADIHGGGIYTINSDTTRINGSPTILHCTFTQNIVSGASSVGGAGIYNENCSPTVTGCVFTGNSSLVQNAGGMVNSNNSSPTVTDCIFTGNIGGGMTNAGNSDPTVTNCIFAGNTHSGVENFLSGNPTLINCTFAGNSGYGILNVAGPTQVQVSNPILINCVLWGDANGEVINFSGAFISHAVITYSDVQGGFSGVGNLNADPRFVRAPFTDGPDDFGDLHLQVGSPALNTGSNSAVPPGITTDLDGNPRISDVIVDMGVYELLIQNLPPVANAGSNQTVTVLHDGDPNTDTIAFTLDGSASTDPNGDALTFQWTDQNSQVLGSAAKLTLTRSPGTYLFTLTVTDPSGASSSATVQVLVLPEPDQPPVADGQSVSTLENTPTSFSLSGSDPDGDAFTYQVTGQPQHGFLFGTAPNFFYIPANDYSGSDSLSFTVTDAYGAIGTATIHLTVDPVNQPPVAYNIGFSTTTNQAISLGLPAGDPDGDPLNYTIVSGPGHGKLTGTGSVRTYTPAAGFTGTDTFTFKVNDGQYDSNIATVTLTVSPPNHAPKAVADKATTPKGIVVRISVLANDSDPDGDPLSVQSITQPAHGTTVLNADNTVTYTPVANFTGTDTFQYTISDGRGGTDTAAVSIKVTK